MTLPDGARIAIVVLCLCAVAFLLRVLAAIVREMLVVRQAEISGSLTITNLTARARRERLVVIDGKTLQKQFGLGVAARRL